MRKAYPLHSFLLDVLYERVASIDKFNRTRGCLGYCSSSSQHIQKTRRV